MSTERRYVPEVGIRTKLASWLDYADRSLPMWAWVLVESVEDGAVTVRLNSDENSDEGLRVTVPLSSIQTPIGWEPRYTIHVEPEKVEEVKAWLKRGVAVRQSHYMPTCATAFQPLDNCDVPGWQFAGDTLVDKIPQEETDKLIRIVKVESVWDAGIPAPCRYCEGTGKHTTNDALEEQSKSEAKCEFCGKHLGFSFTEEWHSHPHEYSSDKRGMCLHTEQPGACWVCHSTGQGMKYLSEMDKKERVAAQKQLQAEGWKVWYDNKGDRGWRMEREVVVKDWAD